MRNSFSDLVSANETEELLTTGEAARLLGVSRQHVVDLCDRGDLPYVLVGSHRRVRQMDVEKIRTRELRMTRDQRRSLWLSHAVAGAIVNDPEWTIMEAKRNLANMRAKTNRNKWMDEWERLLSGSVETLLEALTSTSQRSRELRQNSPLTVTLPPGERDRVLAAFNARSAR